MVIAPLLAAGCVAAIIAEIVRGQLRGAVASAIEILSGEPGNDEITACMKRAVSLADSREEPTAAVVEQLGAGGVADEALAISAYCALVHANDFHRAVLLAINHGGDSDSSGPSPGTSWCAPRGRCHREALERSC